jgi:hypothetical protein
MPLDGSSKKILACASQGAGSDDEARLRALVGAFEVEWFAFDRADKRGSFFRLLQRMRAGGFGLFVLEGTGIAAGLAAILGRLLFGRRYVLSSGDAVAPFLAARMPLGWPVFFAYEWLLYACCDGFIGWTPYLVGRALTLGAPRGVTVPGWAPFERDAEMLRSEGAAIRAELGISPEAMVFGIVGSLAWNRRVQFCYGMELVQAARLAGLPATVLCVFIVGDGEGRAHLEAAAGEALGKTVFLTGRVPRERVPAYLAAMDVGSLPQTMDGIGSFRYTTKVSEYRAVGLPFVTSEIPMAYDLDDGAVVRLPGKTPWSAEYLAALAEMMRSATRVTLPKGAGGEEFAREAQLRRVTAFLEDVLRGRSASSKTYPRG